MNEVPALKLENISQAGKAKNAFLVPIFFFVGRHPTLLGLGRTLVAAFFDSFIHVVLE
jgi:hypothetical protein